MAKKNLLKIIVPLAIIVLVAAMWFIKNSGDTVEATPPQAEVTLPDELKDADFTLTATSEIDFSALAEYGLPVIADYGSDSCIPCQEMAPVLKSMNEEMVGKAFVKFVDVWKYNDAANNVPVQVIPTQVLFNADGTPFVPSDELAAEIPFTMYSSRETDEHVFTVHQGGLSEEQMRSILKEMGVTS